MKSTSSRLSLAILSGVSAVLFPLLASGPGVASAAELKSTYNDIDRCATLEEDQDQFTLKCAGPGGASAVLQYVEGRVGLLFLPSMQGRTLTETDLLTIKPSASKVFPGKLEWRSATGAGAPCAAVIRVPVAKGGSLLVYDLKAGRLAGQSATNNGARRMADGLCAGGSAEAAPEVQPAVQQAAITADDAKLQEAMALAINDFSNTYLQTGISGVSEAVDACYGKAASVYDVARCASVDKQGRENDEAFARRFNMPKYKYFRPKNQLRRFNAAVKRLSIPRDVAAKISPVQGA